MRPAGGPARATGLDEPRDRPRGPAGEHHTERERALSAGAARGRGRLCDPALRAELDGQYVVDLTMDPAGSVMLAAARSHDASPTMRVARSDEGGASFAILSEPLAATALVDPLGERAPVFLRSRGQYTPLPPFPSPIPPA